MKVTNIHVVYKVKQKSTLLEYIGISTAKFLPNRKRYHKGRFGDIELEILYLLLDKENKYERERIQAAS